MYQGKRGIGGTMKMKATISTPGNFQLLSPSPTRGPIKSTGKAKKGKTIKSGKLGTGRQVPGRSAKNFMQE